MKLDVRYPIAVLLVAALAAGACSRQSNGGPVFGQADGQAIRERSQAVAAAFSAANLDQLLALYSPESILMPPQAPTVRGRDAIRTFFEDMLKNGGGQLESSTTDVGGAGELAYEAGTYVLHQKAADGTATRDRGKYMSVWRKRGNNPWMIDYTIWSSDLREPVQVSP
ncbi:MAG: DUF4440 domain-containing protein [Acidobacteriota bacterium]